VSVRIFEPLAGIVLVNLSILYVPLTNTYTLQNLLWKVPLDDAVDLG